MSARAADRAGLVPARSFACLLLCCAALFSLLGCERDRNAGRQRPPDVAPRSGVAPAPDSVPPAWTVSARGVGPVRVGASVEQVRAALTGQLRVPEPPDPACDYAIPVGHGGVSFMIVDGHVARVDVDTRGVFTAAGVRVGDPAERVGELYGGRVRVEPHKYTEGRYLIVQPAQPIDSAYRLIFETSPEGRVVRYRAGRRPEVEWVEGCS